jgi:hypothetical protein
VPSWTGSAIGHSGFDNIPGEPVLYEVVSGSTVHIALANIVVTPPPGSGSTVSYAIIAADGESTNQNESLSFTTNGLPWQEVAQIPNGPNFPALSGVGTATVKETGVAGTVGSFVRHHQRRGSRPLHARHSAHGLRRLSAGDQRDHGGG